VRSKSRCALRLRYVDFVVSNEVAVEVCCYFNVFSPETVIEVQSCKVYNCLIQIILTMVLSIEELVFIS
jgi:hypothetical protein